MRIQDTHGLERGYGTLTLVGQGRKPATIRLPLPVAEVMDAAAGERDCGPLLLRADGKQMDRRAATRVVVRLVAVRSASSSSTRRLMKRDFQPGSGQSDRATLGAGGHGGRSQTSRHRAVQAGCGHAHQHRTLWS